MIKVYILIDRDVKDTAWIDILTAFGPIFAVIVTSAITLYLFNRSMKQQRKDLNKTFTKQNELLQKQISDNIIFENSAKNITDIKDAVLKLLSVVDQYEKNLYDQKKIDSDANNKEWSYNFRKFRLVLGYDLKGEKRKQDFILKFETLRFALNFLRWMQSEDNVDELIKYLRNQEDAVEPSEWEQVDISIRKLIEDKEMGKSYHKKTIPVIADTLMDIAKAGVEDYTIDYVKEEHRRISIGDNGLSN
ncbi:gp53 [Brochothrix phage NF5]|uniref:gp53 n=1 Tax=Brochothrix phage NF5 TaxID=764561 RepID=UPI0001D9ACC2|nr:gp53 [Brochothrix phage NF5]ADH03077.1 gp53 [Brochothrix phage NF5]